MLYVRYLALVSVALAGCQTGVSPEELSSINYGPKPGTWQQEIRSYLALRVPDPTTMTIEYKSEPKQMVQKETAVRDRQWGWATCVFVDENHPRGYQGRYPMTFFFREHQIVAVNGGPDDGNVIGAKYAREQCERLGSPFKS
ncbi:MAG TPA: hypothetical protein VFC18_00920 [Burkholderiales bacterium]|nr:hypothetical protein [Burkholderiales bacterium]